MGRVEYLFVPGKFSSLLALDEPFDLIPCNGSGGIKALEIMLHLGCLEFQKLAYDEFVRRGLFLGPAQHLSRGSVHSLDQCV